MDKFKDGEVGSEYGYLSGYAKPKLITEQCNILRQIFPGVGNALEKLAERAVPVNAEGWFAIPKWEKIAPTYNEAVHKVLNLINQTRNDESYNYREGQLGPERLRQTAGTQKIWETIGNEQKDNDILVVPAQFGLRHRCRSVRCVREIMSDNRSDEFGLGTFAIGIMLLTHPERLMNVKDLGIDCVGDEYDVPSSFVRFYYAPRFTFSDHGVEFGADWFVHARSNYGSATGFVPQTEVIFRL